MTLEIGSELTCSMGVTDMTAAIGWYDIGVQALKHEAGNVGFTVKAGAVWRRFSFDSRAFTRDTVVCGNGGVDRVLGTLACSPSSLFGPTAVYGFPAGNLGEVFDLGDAGQPQGTEGEAQG